MTKNKLIFGALVLAIHSAFFSFLTISGHAISQFAQSGRVNILLHIATLIGLLFIANTVKQKYWRIGAFSTALSGFMRSWIKTFPSKAELFATTSIILSVISVIALTWSWRAEDFDMSWWQTGSGTNKRATSYIGIVLILLVIAGIFLLWGIH